MKSLKILKNFCLILFYGYCAGVIFEQSMGISKIHREIKEYDKKIRDLIVQNSKINDEILNLDDSSYRERLAREKYGLIKNKEQIYRDISKLKKNNN